MYITGKDLKKQYGKIFYKIMNDDECHYDYQYVDGLNIDNNKLTDKPCSKGGLYFTTFEYMYKYINHGNTLRIVNIPDDSNVFIERYKFKADKIILCEKTIIPEQVYIKALRKNGMLLKHIKYQTREICLTALNENPLAIQFVNEQTDELCKYALNKNGMVLRLIKNKTKELCICAIKQNINSKLFINNYRLLFAT